MSAQKANTPDLSNINLEELLEAAETVAHIAGEVSLKYFQKKLDIISKADDSPVTVADREAETAMRRYIEEYFPTHGIIGEEHGKTNESARIKWILDPIDGTVGFIHGIPLYTNLVGILVDDVPVVGVINAPAMQENVVAAKGLGAFYKGSKTTLRRPPKLTEASMMTSDVQYFNTYGHKASFEHLLTLVKTHRTWGDAYGHLMVATGRADIMLDPVLSIWDAAALLPVIEEAGGMFTDLNGVARVDGGHGFSAAPELHKQLLPILKSYQ